MGTTLISFIGKGRRKEGDSSPTYDTANYEFKDEPPVEASVFYNAILDSKKYEIENSLIIGTRTSSWAVLLGPYLDKGDAESEELYLKIAEYEDKDKDKDKDKAKDVDDKTLKELENVLSKKRNMTVKCVATDSEINENNAFDIISLYFSEIAQCKSGDLLIDITHGFRSMPILLMSALQFVESLKPITGKIDVIYGEFGNKNENGNYPVRYLTAVWEITEISRAVNTFFQKFDATDLCKYLNPFWPLGARALNKLGGSLQGNLILWLDAPLAELKTALDTPVSESKCPKWFPTVKDRITKFYRELAYPQNKYEQCLCIANLFKKQKIYGQALIALQLAFEAFLFEYYKSPANRYGDFEYTRQLGERFYEEQDLAEDEKSKLILMRQTRNQVAHGGTTIRGTPAAPEKLPNFYKKSLKNLKGVVERFT